MRTLSSLHVLAYIRGRSYVHVRGIDDSDRSNQPTSSPTQPVLHILKFSSQATQQDQPSLDAYHWQQHLAQRSYILPAKNPPSTGIVTCKYQEPHVSTINQTQTRKKQKNQLTPLTHPAPSPANQTATPTKSRAFPNPPNGCNASNAPLVSSSSKKLLVKCVAAYDGANAFTWIPCGAQSSAAALVRFTTPPFAAQ